MTTLCQATPPQSQLIARRSVLLASLLLPVALTTRAAPSAVPPEVAERLPQARLQGAGRLTFFALHVYDARLWADADFKPTSYSQQPLALELDYARSLDGKAIAERSIEEMRRQADLSDRKAASWLAQMSAIFPDVNAGDRITGIQRPNEATSFFFNGRPSGEIRDPEFTALFFGIWLSAKTSEPALRKALIGGAGRST
ncbi:MAG: chalcone isomerase family protein [Ideonella sp.]